MKLKNIIAILITIFLLVIFIDLSNSEECILGYPYDIPFWIFLEIFTITASVIIAFFSIIESNDNLSKQLKIEQTPYVVLDRNIELRDINIFGDLPAGYSKSGCIYLKNIGRGFAKNIEMSYESTVIKGLFNADQPHSINLSQGEKSVGWKVDVEILKKIEIQEVPDFIFLYIFYQDQLDNRYKTKIKLARHQDRYKLMENISEVMY